MTSPPPLLVWVTVVTVVVTSTSSVDTDYHAQDPTTTTAYTEDMGYSVTELVDFEMLTQNGTLSSEVFGSTNSSLTALEEMDEEGSTRFCSSGNCFGWDRYHRLEDLNGYLDYLQETYRGLVTVETMGWTAEGRPLRLARVHPPSATGAKPAAVWLDGGTHAREWVTPAAAMFVLRELLASLEAGNSTFSGLDFYVVPVVNPDGYEYSHTTDRLWRKNRSPNNGSSCVGTDLNRNWGFKWGGRYSTADPCSPNYRGLHAFSESESAAVSKYILKKSNQVKAYLSLHSYGQSVLFPWAYTDRRTPDFKDLFQLASLMAKRVKAVTGQNYRYGTVSTTLYPASGGSQDWVKAEAGVKYCFTMELRDNGRYGFELPVDQILPSSKDALAAFTVLSQKVKTGKDFTS